MKKTFSPVEIELTHIDFADIITTSKNIELPFQPFSIRGDDDDLT